MSRCRGVYTYAYGEPIDAKVIQPIIMGDKRGVRYVATGWNGSGSAPEQGEDASVQFAIEEDSSIEWIWEKEYELVLHRSVDGQRVTERTWHKAGAEMSIASALSPGYRFEGWSGDVKRRHKMDDPLIVIMDEPRTITENAIWRFLQITVNAGPDGSVEPSGVVEVERGDTITFEITADDEYHIADVQLDGVTVDGFKAEQKKASYTVRRINKDQSLDVFFKKDSYEITVVSPYGETDPEPGAWTYESGTIITARVLTASIEDGPGVKHNIMGWDGIGTVPSEGEQDEVVIEVTGNGMLTWLWDAEYLLTVETRMDEQGSRVQQWHNADASVDLTTEAIDGYIFVGWQGDVPEGSGVSETISVEMDKPRKVIKKYQWNRHSIFLSSGKNGSIEPKGSVEVDKGGTLSVTAKAEDYHHIDKVWVDGSVVANFDQGQNTYTYTFGDVREDHTLEVFFSPNWYQLEIISPWGDVQPARGRHQFKGGVSLTARAVPRTVMANDGRTRYLLKGWEGAGSIPEKGDTNVISFVMGKNSRLEWIWQPEYRLSIQGGKGGAVAATASWYPADQIVTVSVEAVSGYKFMGWRGDVPESLKTENPITLVMNQPRDLMTDFLYYAGDIRIDVWPDNAPWRIAASPESYKGNAEGVGSTLLTSAPVGQYKIEFLKIDHFETPPPQMIYLEPGKKVTVDARYTEVPELAVSTNLIKQFVTPLEGARSKYFEVWNQGKGQLRYAVTRNVSWLGLSPKIGQSTGEHDRVRIDFDTENLMPGVYKGIVTVSHKGSVALPERIEVILNVLETKQELKEAIERERPDDQGLVAYYPFNESVDDMSIYANHGVEHGDIQYVPHNPHGSAAVLDQRGSTYIEIPHDDQLILKDSFTIQFWYRPGTHPGRLIQKLWPAKKTEKNEWEITMRDDGNVFFKYAWPGTSGNYEFVCPINASWAQGTWNHYVYAYSKPENRMYSYLNGVEVTNQVPQRVVTPLDSTLPITVMYDRYETSSDARFDAEGELDEFAIWNKLLSPEDIQTLYLKGVTELKSK